MPPASMISPMRGYISPNQAAKMLGKKRDFIVALIRAGELPAIDERRPGAAIPRWAIDPADIRVWKRSRQAVPSSPSSPIRRYQFQNICQEMRDARRERQAAKNKDGRTS